MLGPKERFSSRVEDYVRYRPYYPAEILELLRRECGLLPDWRVADVGSGPGNLARLFLDNGNFVLAVEPNRDMREAGSKLLGSLGNYSSIDGCAESTGLASQSVDLVVAGQAFHWFEPASARTEFERILKPGGWVALIWNMRRIDGSSFAVGYEEILRELPEYEAVKADGAPIDKLRSFFAPFEMRQATFANRQTLDRASFLGRVLSSSYVPLPGQPAHEAILGALNDLFDREAQDGLIRFEYDAEVFFGRLSDRAQG